MTTATANLDQLRTRIATAKAPAFGGFNLSLLWQEIRRVLSNARALIFTVFMPVLFLFLFSSASDGTTFEHGNLGAWFTISMALYGGLMAAATGGAVVALERSEGWSRALRLTPLSPTAYIAIKLLSAALRSLFSVVVVYVVAFFVGTAHMTATAWVTSALIVWVGSFVFAAFGLAMGFLLSADSVMQVMSFILVILAFLGGIFYPVDQYPAWLQEIAKFTPAYGLHQLSLVPLVGGSVQWGDVVSVVAWFAIFAGAAAYLFKRDTKRV